MKRYEWKQINKDLDWWGLWDNVRHAFVIETSTSGKKVYEKLAVFND